jgi:hypothetical protein
MDEISVAEAKQLARAELARKRSAARPKVKKTAAEHIDPERLDKAIRYLKERPSWSAAPVWNRHEDNQRRFRAGPSFEKSELHQRVRRARLSALDKCAARVGDHAFQDPSTRPSLSYMPNRAPSLVEMGELDQCVGAIQRCNKTYVASYLYSPSPAAPADLHHRARHRPIR